MTIRRLGPGDEPRAQELFRLFADVFEEEYQALTLPYLTRLLARADFWAMAAFAGDAIVGGITAHCLPMTRAEVSELFIYDLAVAVEHQRQGIGRALVAQLLEAAAAEGIGTAFVPADNEDTHALDFYRAIGGTESPVTLFVFP